jgi:hypothetical protein
MKSKQLDFFILPADWAAIFNFLETRECKIIIAGTSGNIQLLTSAADIVEKGVFQFYICRRDDISEMKIENIDELTSQIDSLRSECIEFSTGGFYPYSNKELHRARFYYIIDYYADAGNVVKKSNRFILWADAVITSFKNEFLMKAKEYPNNLFSKKCIDWIKQHNAILKGGGMSFKID